MRKIKKNLGIIRIINENRKKIKNWCALTLFFLFTPMIFLFFFSICLNVIYTLNFKYRKTTLDYIYFFFIMKNLGMNVTNVKLF